MTNFYKALLLSSTLTLVACGGGGSSSDTPTTPTPPVSTAPTADFTVSASSGMVPLDVSFTSTSDAGSAAITDYLWDFGDGTTSTEANPTHTYTTAGDFDITLTVTSSAGSDTEARTDFLDVDPSAVTLDPEEVQTFDIDGQSLEAASQQVIVLMVEDVTQEQIDLVFAGAEAAGAGVQAFDLDFRMIQLTTTAGEELNVAEALDGLDGVSIASLNFVDTEDFNIENQNTKGFEAWQNSQEAKTNIFTQIGAEQRKVTIDSSFTGGYWVDQIGLEDALSALEDITLDQSPIGIVDTGLPATQGVITESRVSRFNFRGDAITDDDTFGTGEGQSTHGLNVAAFAAGDTATAQGVNASSDVIIVDVSSFSRPLTLFGLETPIVRTFMSDSTEGIRTAIEEGATVVNVSLGDSSECSDSQTVRLESRRRWRAFKSAAVNFARRNDANMVFSAGNNCEKQDDQLLPDPNDLDNDSWESHALIVAANNADLNDADFSRMGDIVNLAAPGEQVSFDSTVSPTSGTSFAAPLVTGSVGLVRSINDTLSAPESRSIILRTVSETLVPETVAAHQASRASFPSDTAQATAPSGILNLAGAIQTALLAQDIDLTTLDEFPLALGASQTITVDVTLPEDGVGALDVVFLIDRSGSYADDINTLQSQATEIVTSLTETDIDIQFGVASFSDFPISPFGLSTDEAFTVLQTLTADTTATVNAINLLDQPLQNGNDSPESQYEALFQVASNALNFRDGALPIIVLATDADFHDSDVEPDYPGAGRTETLAALTENNIAVFGLQSGGSFAAGTRLTELADETGGAVFNLDSASSEIASAISNAVDEALQEADIRLDILGGDDWVSNITPAVHEDVAAGTTVSFDVEFTGIRNGSFFDDLSYDVYLWALANDEALVSRFRQTIDAD